MKLKISLADNWQQLHKRGVVLLSSALATISAFGPVIRDAWHNVPDDLRAVIPAHAQQAIAYAIMFASIVAVRYTTIRRVPREGSDGSE